MWADKADLDEFQREALQFHITGMDEVFFKHSEEKADG